MPAKRGLSNHCCVWRTSHSNGLIAASWWVMLTDIVAPPFIPCASDNQIAIASWEWDATGSEVEVFGDPGAVGLQCLHVPGDALPRLPGILHRLSFHRTSRSPYCNPSAPPKSLYRRRYNLRPTFSYENA